jgi:hypothetical protein
MFRVGTNSTQEGKSSVHETSVHETYIRSADETPCLCRAFEATGPTVTSAKLREIGIMSTNLRDEFTHGSGPNGLSAAIADLQP